MALPIVSNPESSGFNCYCSHDEAVTILGSRLHIDNWNAKGETDQKRALLVATNMLDTYVDWTGYVADNDQELAWPRKYVPRKDRATLVYWPDNIIPEFLKLATAELANDLLGGSLDADLETGLKSLKVGSISLAFDKTDRKDPIPDSIRILIQDYGEVMGQSGDRIVRVQRA